MAKAAKIEKDIKQETPKTDLIIATEIQPAILFGEDHQTLEDLLESIKKEVSTIVPDITTAKGRKAITANVSRITKSKTLLDKVGKEYNAAQKELLKTFDSRRKHAFTFLEDLQKEVRKPLTEWEDKEKARIAKNEGIVNAFIKAGEDSENWMNLTIEELGDLLVSVEEVTITKRLAEFEEEAEIAKKESIRKINNSIDSRKKYDSEQKELEKLRADAAEADRIRFEADQRAEAERAAQQQVIDANKETEAAEKRAEAAEQQRITDAENADKQRGLEVEAAAQAERDRIEAEKMKEEREAAAREADTKHRGKINRAIVKELLKCNIDEAQAKKVVTAIAKNNIPNVKINY